MTDEHTNTPLDVIKTEIGPSGLLFLALSPILFWVMVTEIGIVEPTPLRNSFMVGFGLIWGIAVLIGFVVYENVR